MSRGLGDLRGIKRGKKALCWGQRGLHPQEVGDNRVQSTCLGKPQEKILMG